MNNSNEPSTKLTQSLPSECKQAVAKYGADYQKRLITCTKQIIPSGDLDADMREIKLYFKDFKGKKPEKFTIGNI